MKKALVPIVVLLIVCVVIVVAVMPSTPAATKKLAEEISTASANGKTVFLQLSSTGCVTCRKMKPEFEKLVAELSADPRFFIINVDVDSHSSIASQFAVSAVPTQVILSSAGKEVFRNIGYLSYDNMKSAVKTALGN